MSNLEIGKTLKELNLQIFKVVRKRHSQLGIDLTPIQATIILALYENKDILYQKHLEPIVACNKSTLSSILDTMEKKELIKRVTMRDTRKNGIVLTKKSYDLTKLIAKDKKELDKKMVKDLTREEIENFKITLNKMLSNLERM